MILTLVPVLVFVIEKVKLVSRTDEGFRCQSSGVSYQMTEEEDRYRKGEVEKNR
jgi:hypothetical protein